MQNLRIDIELEDINAVDIDSLYSFLQDKLQPEKIEISEVTEILLNGDTDNE